RPRYRAQPRRCPMPTVACPFCQQTCRVPSGSEGRHSSCPHCQKPFVIPGGVSARKEPELTEISLEPAPEHELPTAAPLRLNHLPLLLGLIGTITLLVGVFTPIVSVPIVGSLNYFLNGR